MASPGARRQRRDPHGEPPVALLLDGDHHHARRSAGRTGAEHVPERAGHWKTRAQPADRSISTAFGLGKPAARMGRACAPGWRARSRRRPAPGGRAGIVSSKKGLARKTASGCHGPTPPGRYPRRRARRPGAREDAPRRGRERPSARLAAQPGRRRITGRQVALASESEGAGLENALERPTRCSRRRRRSRDRRAKATRDLRAATFRRLKSIATVAARDRRPRAKVAEERLDPGSCAPGSSTPARRSGQGPRHRHASSRSRLLPPDRFATPTTSSQGILQRLAYADLRRHPHFRAGDFLYRYPTTFFGQAIGRERPSSLLNSRLRSPGCPPDFILVFDTSSRTLRRHRRRRGDMDYLSRFLVDREGAPPPRRWRKRNSPRHAHFDAGSTTKADDADNAAPFRGRLLMASAVLEGDLADPDWTMKSFACSSKVATTFVMDMRAPPGARLPTYPRRHRRHVSGTRSAAQRSPPAF